MGCLVNQFCYYQILQRTAYALKKSDVLRALPHRLPIAGDLVQVGEYMVSSNRLFFHRDHQVTRFSKTSLISIDHNSRALDGPAVHLSRMRLEGSDQIQMRPGAKPVSLKQR